MNNLTIQPNIAPDFDLTFTPLLPIMEPHQAIYWLEEYFSRETPHIVGDDLGTCWTSTAAVILTALVTGHRPTLIAEITSFPSPFINAVLKAMTDNRLWNLEAMVVLSTNLRTKAADWECIKLDLECAMEWIWDAIYTPEAYIALESLRQRILYGGQPQRWVDKDAAGFFQLTLEQ